MTYTYSTPIAGLLRLLQAHDSEIENRIRIQKSVYLLQTHGFADFERLRFVYHHYGPYSQQLSDVLRELVAAGLVAELRSEYGEDQVKYVYRLTESGKEWLRDNEVEVPEHLTTDTTLLKSSHWRSLELASTILFLLKEGSASDLSSATAKALELKPGCRAYTDEALPLVQHFVHAPTAGRPS